MSDTAARARRNMGIVTALALLINTTLTHWPNLSLGTPQDPAPDKVIHLVGFALLTAGAWFSGWVRSLALLWIIGVAWAALDEWTQGFGIPGRVRDIEDWCANIMGVTIAVAWIAATRPITGWESNRRRAARDDATARLFCRAWPWPLVALGAGLGAAAPLPVFLWISARSWAMPPRQVLITGLIVVAIASAHASIEVLLRMTTLEKRPMLPDRVMARLVAGPVLAALAILILLTALAQLSLGLRLHLEVASLFDEWYRRRSQTLRSAIDLSLILLLAAWATRRARRNVAARINRTHLECVRCDQSLTGLPMKDGRGTCPECGTPYDAPPGVGAAVAAPG